MGQNRNRMSRKLKFLAALNIVGWAIVAPLLVSSLVRPLLGFEDWPGSSLPDRPAGITPLVDVGPQRPTPPRSDARRARSAPASAPPGSTAPDTSAPAAAAPAGGERIERCHRRHRARPTVGIGGVDVFLPGRPSVPVTGGTGGPGLAEHPAARR